ncbi:two-component system VirA-like sensor kinase [Bradyrhizobium liaoningense]|uniref:two-component system VirA-like sensor kinase n=1 Tax=Bradyrhizobium liaoningense TaxID=43992 RepID=UPI001BA9ADA4|nr:two-component system VirA-like sensor kinase [Bradyrhizobium liaoningense]MBR0816622.1 two-component system VirA-like sensor kinase [Bradyrhizobium liaoningense]
MTAARSVAIIVGLAALLTWFSLRAINPDAELFDRAFNELEHFGVIENTLYRDVFTARTGMLGDYDPLGNEINALRKSLDRLRATAAIDRATSEAIDRLAELVDQQEQLVEAFKSQNAVLHNSLSFFARFRAHSDLRELDLAVSSAAAAILHLTLDTTSTSVGEAEMSLDNLEWEALRTNQAYLVEPFLAHGRLLRKLLPSVDGILKTMMTLPRTMNQDALRATIIDRQIASRNVARLFRRLLYATSLALVAFLVHLGIRLGARANILHRRAALEHMIADISMNFINATPQSVDLEIRRAIASFGTFAGSDRVYLVVSGVSTRSYVWQQPDKDFPPGWPEQAPDLAARIGPDRNGIVHVPRVGRMPVGENQRFLTDLGLGGWACAVNTDSQGRVIAFGFDAVGRKCRIAHPSELLLLRMALDTFIHAIERQVVDEERSRLQRRLQHARRMERIGTFTSGIAHNFNNILGGVLGHAEVMEGHVGRNVNLVRHLAGIRLSAERARDLISQILAFGRRREIRRNPLSINALVDETVSLLCVSLPVRIELVVKPSPVGLIVLGEAAQLQQVIMNLCNNAAHAISDKGRIEVSIEPQETFEPMPLSHDKIEAGHYVRLSVVDTGSGMEDMILERIFEPFFTTRQNGNGLGLATVRDIVHDHVGGIGVSSLPGRGTRFDIWLPRVEAAVLPAAKRLVADGIGHGEVVMLVGGDSGRLLGDEEMLAALGYEAVGFTTADSARAACDAAPDRFDFVIVGQVGSPKQSLELASQLHRSIPSIPIVLATRVPFEIAADTLLSAGISDVVQWPIVAEEVAIVLSQSSPAAATRGLDAARASSSLTHPA